MNVWNLAQSIEIKRKKIERLIKSSVVFDTFADDVVVFSIGHISNPSLWILHRVFVCFNEKMCFFLISLHVPGLHHCNWRHSIVNDVSPQSPVIWLFIGYQLAAMEENTPSIRELFSQFRNVHANQGIRPVTNALNINNNNNNTTTNQHSNNNNNGYEIHNHPNQQAMPSTSTSTSPPASASRSISPRLMMLVNQFQNASVSNMLPNRTQIIEYTKKVQPEMRVHVQMATKFHGVDKSKIGICMYIALRPLIEYN